VLPGLRDLHIAHTNFWLGDGQTVGKLHFDPYDNMLVPVQGRKVVLMMPPYNNQRIGEGHLQEGELAVDISAGRTTPGRLLESTSMVNSPFDLMARRSLPPIPQERKESDTDKFGRYDSSSVYGMNSFGRPSLQSVHAQTLGGNASMEGDSASQDAFDAARRDGVYVCVAEPGQAVWLPSFWWHEVISEAGTEIHEHEDGSNADADLAFSAAVNYWFEPLLTKEFPCSDCDLSLNTKQYYDMLVRFAAGETST